MSSFYAYNIILKVVWISRSINTTYRCNHNNISSTALQSRAGLQTHFFKHVPGILTGVGIIGTFTGLIVGLLGFDVSSPDRVQAALSQLVQTVGQAFMVSAVAIALAMVFTWVEKALLAARYRQVALLQQHLDSLFAPKGGAEYMERMALAAEMQVALSTQILSQLRSAAPKA